MIRPAEPRDEAALDRLIRGARKALARDREHLPTASERLSEALADPDRRLFVVELDGAVVGFVELALGAPDPEAVTVVAIAIDRELRGRGHGDAALREAMAALDRPFARVEAGVHEENLAALGFFEAHGLSEVERGQGVVIVSGCVVPRPIDRS